MFILNKKSGLITECTNEDVIAHCKKNLDEYGVAKTADELKREKAEKSADKPEEVVAPEEPETLPEDPIEEETEEAAEDVDYSSFSVAELRKVAKSKGIQGYANMNKETLVEVIKAHE